MAKEIFKPKDVERAHWWMAKALDTLAEADALIPSGRTRLGAVNRLYYAAHNISVAMLRLIGNPSKKHTSIVNQFGIEWVKKRNFPKSYGRLLRTLHDDRDKADYGEYVPTFPEVLEKMREKVDSFLNRAWKAIPAVSMVHILEIIGNENPQIRDFSFDFYCPKTYFHHTRLSVWVPKGRLSDRLLNKMVLSSRQQMKNLGVKESNDYVLGLNSRVNQYNEEHLLMLDFDDVSTLPYHKLSGEPGFFFRTESGFHFIGSQLYNFDEWEKRMSHYSKIASSQHCELSFKRRYGTLRITESPRKPVKPAYIGRSKPT